METIWNTTKRGEIPIKTIDKRLGLYSVEKIVAKCVTTK